MEIVNVPLEEKFSKCSIFFVFTVQDPSHGASIVRDAPAQDVKN